MNSLCRIDLATSHKVAFRTTVVATLTTNRPGVNQITISAPSYTGGNHLTLRFQARGSHLALVKSNLLRKITRKTPAILCDKSLVSLFSQQMPPAAISSKLVQADLGLLELQGNIGVVLPKVLVIGTHTHCPYFSSVHELVPPDKVLLIPDQANISSRGFWITEGLFTL